ncbi:MAG: tRNA (adenosine(37)-N6)-threonylcarbamoyltransferase complex transferase subunit TsaD [Deltaproteobacteria bacterium]|nr:tRNA (adenosine(37)-N6)-threonylcarbamoyltransferase complex transferase subunit TsaD [Deltaproteobacteria bacterium]MBW1862165.1 tRNA (adenosine(37)-N6)-threonylcarbamoyltransferase complex transferase subunit TsaD [Deltaproteobacteria bacterium]
MNILGIDTSCDDTSAAVVADGHLELSSVVNSQVSLHHPYGGVVPELASREHLRNIVPVVREALSTAKLEIKDLDGIAVTVGPGLIGSLLVGLYYAKALTYVHQIPLVAINHLEGHILSIFLEDDVPEFPFVVLTASGGHTSLYHVKGFGNYDLMGQTLDDAAGEAFDKVSRLLGLGYPGGVAIEKLARSGRKDRIDFPRAYLSPDSLEFSFSGLKTSVALYVKKQFKSEEKKSQINMADIAASFQEAVVDVLVRKLMKARERTGVNAVVISGGVACNHTLRERLKESASDQGICVYCPRPEYCTDNGAMIAVAGFHRIIHGEQADLSTDVRSRFPIEELASLTHSQTTSL